MSASMVVVDDEIEVLKSIYSENCISFFKSFSNECIGSVSYKHNRPNFIIIFDLPLEYPNYPPIIKFDFEDRKTIGMNISSVENVMSKLIHENRGEVVLYTLIEAAKEIILGTISLEKEEDLHQEDESMSSAVGSNLESNYMRERIVHGTIFTVKKSSFQSHCAPVQSMEEVKLFQKAVFEDKKVLAATHNIFAYRFTCVTSSIVFHDFDDDGETAAGSRVAEMIRLMGLDGVAVIVSRWFGGINLGPDRFKFICNSARSLLLETGCGSKNICAEKGRKKNLMKET